MKLASFCILTILSLLYAGLTIAETLTYHKWEQSVNDQRYLQAQVSYFDHLNQKLDEMVRRMAVVSQRDPAMSQVLKEHNINVIVDGSSAPASAQNGFNAPPPPNPNGDTQAKPDQTLAPPASSHP